MNIDGHHVYFDQRLMQQPNHQRVERMLREMDCQCHAERRATSIYRPRDSRSVQPLLVHWAQALRQAFQ